MGFGIVGYGWVARDFVAPAIRRCTAARLAAACDPDPAARTAATAAGVPFVTADLAALMGHPEVQAVYVATPNHRHREVTVAAAAAGRHVLCEKPMAGTLADAEAMAAACRDAGIRYATAFDQRHHPAHAHARGMVKAGMLGDVTAVRIVYCCWVGAEWAADNWRIDPARAGGGAMVDLAPHGLDLAEFLVGEPVVEAAALAQRRVQDYAVDDGAVVVGRTASGVLLQLHVAYNHPETLPRRRLEVVGTAGLLTATDTMGQTAGGTLTLAEASTGRVVPVAYPDRDRSPFDGLVATFTAETLAGVQGWLEEDLAAMRLLERLRAMVDRPERASR